MMAEGKIRVNESRTEVLNSDGKWVDINTTDMSHLKDAVKAWNDELKYSGAKSPEVRQWMLDSKNYELDSSSNNRSDGAKLKERYDPPVPYKEKTE
jgi:hypothetical protein